MLKTQQQKELEVFKAKSKYKQIITLYSVNVSELFENP
jgi:hypothetical protein